MHVWSNIPILQARPMSQASTPRGNILPTQGYRRPARVDLSGFSPSDVSQRGTTLVVLNTTQPANNNIRNPHQTQKDMELSCPNRIITSCHFSNVPQRPTLLSAASMVLPVKNKRLRAAVVVVGDCGSCGAELLEMEEWSEMLKWGDHKCRGSSNGVVELLECLEREAIMGEDEGTEAVDYNRRAHIFDKSARVFQALKHQAEDEHVEKEEADDSGHS